MKGVGERALPQPGTAFVLAFDDADGSYFIVPDDDDVLGLTADDGTFPGVFSYSGEPPTSSCVFDVQHKDGTTERIDRLTNAEIVELDNGEYRVTGVSDHLLLGVGVAPREATVTWILIPRS